MLAELIAKETGLSLEYVFGLARSATYRYKTYFIPKRSGEPREINHPARELKLLQRWLLDRVLSSIRIHPAAFGYRRGTNVAMHAGVHVSNNFLLKVDFRNFFPSIRSGDVETALRRSTQEMGHASFSGDDIKFIRQIVCRKGRLTIGAPTSPTISNIVMRDFDGHWWDVCTKKGIAYTRYADDLCFSCNEKGILQGLLTQLRTELTRTASPQLILNDEKTVFTSRKRKRMVTGIVLTSDKKLSLGRLMKRKIRTLVYLSTQDTLSPEQLAYLRGFLAYARSVEPSFIASLHRKFGDTNLERLKA
jgi:retron-type reverse transcriptase